MSDTAVVLLFLCLLTLGIVFPPLGIVMLIWLLLTR